MRDVRRNIPPGARAGGTILMLVSCAVAGCQPAVPTLEVSVGAYSQTFTDPAAIKRILDGVDCGGFARRAGAAEGYLRLGMLSYNGEGIVSSLGTEAQGEIVFVRGRWARRGDAWQYLADLPELQPAVDEFIERAGRATGSDWLDATTRPAPANEGNRVQE